MPKNPRYVTDQGFPNTVKEWGEKIHPSGGGMGNFTKGRFFIRSWASEKECIWPFNPFFKVKNIIL